MLALLLALTFGYFSRVYRRGFLIDWSISWAFLMCAVLSLAIITAFIEPQDVRGFGSLVATFASLAFSYLYALYLVTGAQELLTGQSLRKRVYRWVIAIVLVGALVSTIVFLEPDEGRERYAIRIGIRFLVLSVALAVVGFFVFMRKRRSPGIGHRILTFGLLSLAGLYGLYTLVVIAFLINRPAALPAFFGVADMVVMAGIGMGMLVWLLEDERERLQKANRELDSFLYRTSHDLRAPIASILGLINLSNLELKDPHSLKMLQLIEERVKKLDGVIGDILQLARSKKSSLTWQLVSLDQLIDEVVADLKFARNAPAISLRYQRAAEHRLRADYNLLKTILGNLFSNAVKYHRTDQPSPYIEVTYQQEPDCTVIEVIDNGQGISEQSLPQIFDMFYRASEQSDGTGLGLYIVQEAVIKMGGHISVRSRLGEGTTFTISLPSAD